MKKYIKSFAVIAVMIAGGRPVQAQAITEKLGIGYAAPAIKAFKWLKGTPVSEFRKGHIYVVEFGATWCTPCRAAVPALTSIAQKYKNEVSVISFFVMEYNDQPLETKQPRYVNNVENYVLKNGNKMAYTVAVDDPAGFMQNTWLKAAGKEGIPAMFIIDKNGLIAWAGSSPVVLDSMVQVVKSPGYTIAKQFEKANDQPAVTDDSPLSRLKASAGNVLFISSLSLFSGRDHEGRALGNNTFIDSYRWAKPSSVFYKMRGEVELIGEDLRRLYYMAHGDTLWNAAMMRKGYSGKYPDTAKEPQYKKSYGQYWYRPILELTDSSEFMSTARSPKNRFNYFLKMPVGMATAAILQQQMQKDLKLYFGYEAVVETRLMPYWRLAINDVSKSVFPPKDTSHEFTQFKDEQQNTWFGNADMRDLIYQLEIRYGHSGHLHLVDQPEYEPPFIDETGIKGGFDIKFPAEHANKIIAAGAEGNEYPFKEYCTMLRDMGFEITKEFKKMKVVVIRAPAGSN